MPITFLEVMNDTLRRVGAIQGNNDLVTATVASTATGAFDIEPFERSGIQRQIDLAEQLWRETYRQINSLGMFPFEAATATLTLADGIREYDLPQDFQQMSLVEGFQSGVLRGATNSLILLEYPGGYARMLVDQPVATDWTGDPQHWALSPVFKASASDTQRMRIDRHPATDQDGHTYNFMYDRKVTLSGTNATDTLPFSEAAAQNLVPVIAQAWNSTMKQQFSSREFNNAIINAISDMTAKNRQQRYGRRRG